VPGVAADAEAALAQVPHHLRETAGRVLAAMVTSMRGADAYWTTGDLAARLGVRARTPERDSLNSALSCLQRTRRPRLLRYEVGATGLLEWQLTDAGAEVARSLPVGVSGAPRRLDSR